MLLHRHITTFFLIYSLLSCIYNIYVDCNRSRSIDSKGKYDKSVSLFSPEGNLLQVDYADIAGEKGLPLIIICSDNDKCISIVSSSLQSSKLVDRRIIDKINRIDDNIWLAFSGLAGDGSAIVRDCRNYCIYYNVKYGNKPSITTVARYIGDLQHRSTLTSGERPFGIHTTLIGYDSSSNSGGSGGADGDSSNSNRNVLEPKIFLIKASGEVTQWSAIAIGKNCRENVELLEAKYNPSSSTFDNTRIALDILKSSIAKGSDKDILKDSIDGGDSTISDTLVDTYLIMQDNTCQYISDINDISDLTKAATN